MTGIYCLVIVMTIFGALAGYCLKRSATTKDIGDALSNPWLYYGGVLYVLAAVINIAVLQHMQYSVALPLTSLTYIWTLVIARCLLSEAITLTKVIGTGLILAGAVSISL